MENVVIRDFVASDSAGVLAINDANQPAVGPLDAARLEALASQTEWLPVVEVDGKVAGFAILLVEGADYASPNYRWFSERHERFYYVDRIAIGDGAQGRGLGARLYAGAAERARGGGRPVLCAEVNTIPPNEGSLRFHAREGFREVGRERPYDPDTEVAMLERPTGA